VTGGVWLIQYFTLQILVLATRQPAPKEISGNLPQQRATRSRPGKDRRRDDSSVV